MDHGCRFIPVDFSSIDGGFLPQVTAGGAFKTSAGRLPDDVGPDRALGRLLARTFFESISAAMDPSEEAPPAWLRSRPRRRPQVHALTGRGRCSPRGGAART